LYSGHRKTLKELEMKMDLREVTVRGEGYRQIKLAKDDISGILVSVILKLMFLLLKGS
jgi:hypothetical protein